MTDTATDPEREAPVRRRQAIVNFPTETPMSEYADAESLSAQGVDDTALEALGELTELTSLSIDGEFGDEGMAHLAGLTQLTSLNITSPNVSSRGLRALEGATGLTSLSMRNATLSAKGARACGKLFPGLTTLSLQGKTLGVDHLIMLRGLPKLEVLNFTGGGDIFGGGDSELDRMSATEFVSGSPELKYFTASWWNGRSMVSDQTAIAMIMAKPGITVNGTWYDARVFDEPVAPGEAGGSNGSAGDIQAGVVDLTSETFDAVVGSAGLLLLHVTTTNQDICKAAVVSFNALGTAVDQLPVALAGQAVVARIDEHTTGDFVAQLRERYSVGTGQLVVFRRGELVGRLGARSAHSVLDQLQPVLG